MTLEDYLNPEIYPLSSQGLPPLDQFRIDAINFDNLRQWIAEGNEITQEQAAVLAELEVKVPAQRALMAEID